MDAEKRVLKVLFVAADNSGPSYHDLFIPTNYFHKYNLLKCRIVNSLEQTVAEEADIVGFQRQYVPEVLMYSRMAKTQGRVVCTIVDDNIWALPPNNPANKVYSGIILDRYEAILREVHAVTTSTPYLRELVLPFNKNCYIHRNLVEPFLNEFVSPGQDIDAKGTIRLGWHLTVHHFDDYLVIQDALRQTMKKYNQVKLVLMGYKLPICDTLPRNRWEYYDFVPVDAFYPALANLDFDIGIAPLEDNPFNWGKTARKAQEYAILGIPMILAPIKTYAEWTHGENCIKPPTNDTEGWLEAFSYMIENPQDHMRLARNAYDKVLNDHDINKYIFERAATYYKIYNDVKNTNLEIPTLETWSE